MNEYIKNKWAIGFIWLAVALIIVWIIAGTTENKSKNNIPVDQQTYAIEESESGENLQQTQPTENQGHFLVKTVSGIVNVYWVDGSGEYLHKETSIAYDLLSGQDQQLLDNGIKFDTDEELAAFLENYDS